MDLQIMAAYVDLRQALLVVPAVGDPPAQIGRCAAPVVQPEVERVVSPVALLKAEQGFGQLRPAQRARHGPLSPAYAVTSGRVS